eukprot:NODE_1376_length_2500_cov_27.116308.p1 GENE.NODE_1376_length_2500_cov_27.116308~~NODE_1376_length_2500_cov_27.116308.p1  ORF type:complete len:740 (-),score=109.79 NODE_1376_length_2500_cov_27.116308:279-2273(-)
MLDVLVKVIWATAVALALVGVLVTGGLEYTNLIYALHSFVIIYGAMLVIKTMLMGNRYLLIFSEEQLRVKYRAMGRMWDRWIMLYLVIWTIIALLTALALFFWAPSSQRHSFVHTLPRLAAALVSPQLLLIAAHEFGPFEIARTIARTQLVSLSLAIIGALFACAGFGTLVWNTALGAILGVFIGVAMVFTVFSLWSSLQKAEDKRRGSAKEEHDVQLCTLCRADTADALNLPCGHLFFCFGCANRFQEHEGGVCNACRQPSTLSLVGDRLPARVPDLGYEKLMKSEIPLALLVGLWRLWHERHARHRIAEQYWCIGKCGRQVDTVNVPCGHGTHCASCADAWRASHKQACPRCKAPSHIEQAVTTQVCQVCFTDAESINLMAAGVCGHQICIDCAIRFVRNALGDVEEVGPEGLRCPICLAFRGREMSFIKVETVRQLCGFRRSTEPNGEALSEDEVHRFERFVIEARIPYERRSYCKHETCARMLDTALHVAGELPHLHCPYCNRDSCNRCKIKWHGAITCEEAEAISAAALVNSHQDVSIIDATTKACPKCKARITHYHGHGCHHIKPGKGCSNCGFHFCYCCLAAWGSSKCKCKVICNGQDLKDYLVLKPFPYDARCGCAICPDCRPGQRCVHCTGNCVVCEGNVEPGTMVPARAANSSC